MSEPSPQPKWGSGREFLARQRRVREAVGEARAALEKTWGMAIPTAHSPFLRVPWWVSRVTAALRGLKRRFRSSRRRVFIPIRHLATLLVLLLLVGTIASRGFGVYAAGPPASDGGEGGYRSLIRGQEPAEDTFAFAFAAAPMTVAQRRPPQDDPSPAPDGAVSTPSDEGLLSRSDVVTYTVIPGDTLDSIADQFGVASYTIFWVNRLHAPEEIQPGMVLTIPPLSGVPHPVRPGQTLDSIADMYGVRSGNIVGYPPNELKYPYDLEPGQEVFVPGGIIEIPSYWEEGDERPAPTLAKMPGGEKLAWPTEGFISARFGWSRTYGGYHRGIDIANRWGTPIYAAAAGTVVEAGWGSLGWYVAIDHGNGFTTIYGHLGEPPSVSAGDTVEKGQRIGSMGRTYGTHGYASGVHLHFAVRHRGAYIDPLPLLEN